MRELLNHAAANPKPKVMQTNVADFCAVMVDSIIGIKVRGEAEHQLFLKQYDTSRLQSLGRPAILMNEFQVLLFASYLRAVSDFVPTTLAGRVQDGLLTRLEKKCGKKRYELLPFAAFLDRMTLYSEESSRYPTLRFVPVGAVFAEIVYSQGWPIVEGEGHLMVGLGMNLYFAALDKAGDFVQKMSVY